MELGKGIVFASIALALGLLTSLATATRPAVAAPAPQVCLWSDSPVTLIGGPEVNTAAFHGLQLEDTLGGPGLVSGRAGDPLTLGSVGLGGGNYVLAVSDFNADGSPDLVVTGTLNGQVIIGNPRDVMMEVSTDGGRTWSTPTRVSDSSATLLLNRPDAPGNFVGNQRIPLIDNTVFPQGPFAWQLLDPPCNGSKVSVVVNSTLGIGRAGTSAP